MVYDPQVCLTDAAGERRMRLLGFERVALAPGASREAGAATELACNTVKPLA
jgi:hypothetical protein